MSLETFVHEVEILLIEDNPGDVRLTQEILKDSKIHNNVAVVHNGEEAMAYLYRKDEHQNAVRPDLIMLDLNLPKKGGLEVLAQVKQDPELKLIPIVILTSSQAEEDILRSYNLYANCYITKPLDLEQLSQVVHAIENFWLTVVKLPKKRKV